MLAVTGRDMSLERTGRGRVLADALRTRAMQRRFERRNGWRMNRLFDARGATWDGPDVVEAAQRVDNYGFAVCPFDDLTLTSHARRLAQRALLDAGGLRVEVLEEAAQTETFGGYLWDVDPTFAGSGATLTTQLDEILDRYVIQLDRATSVHRFAPYSWGALFPCVALVGDRSEMRATDHALREGLPFAQLGNNCSQTLSHMLDNARLDEQHLRLFNVCDSDGKPLQLEALRWCAPRKVIALGDVAAKRLSRLGVDHVAFPHPQYLRRVESKNLAAWGRRLAEACA